MSVETKPCIVLVVEDDPAVLRVALRMLSLSGFTARGAVDGASAVGMVEADGDAIAIVLLDLTLPGLSGEETLSRIQRARPGLPVVVTSGHSEHEVRHRLAGRRIDGFVQKPYRVGELVECIRSVLEHQTV